MRNFVFFLQNSTCFTSKIHYLTHLLKVCILRTSDKISSKVNHTYAHENGFFFFFFFDWDSLQTRLNSHYEAWSYKKRRRQKNTRYRKSIQKEPTVKRCLLILNLKPLRSQVKRKHSIGREFQSLAMRGKKLLTQTSL